MLRVVINVYCMVARSENEFDAPGLCLVDCKNVLFYSWCEVPGDAVGVGFFVCVVLGLVFVLWVVFFFSFLPFLGISLTTHFVFQFPCNYSVIVAREVECY